jgi:hypothetical protein
MAWPQTTGPVAGYAVYISRNGAPFPQVPDWITLASEPSVVILGKSGESVVVRVAAFDAHGNFGPASAPSEEVRFLAYVTGPPPAPPAAPPEGDGSSGDQSGAQASACEANGVLSGRHRLKLRKNNRQRSEMNLLVALCDGDWIAIDGEGLTLQGSYHKLGDGRKIQLFPDSISRDALRDAISLEASNMTRKPVEIDFREEPALTLKFNRARTRIRLEGLIPLDSVLRGERGDGSYKLRLAGRRDGV